MGLDMYLFKEKENGENEEVFYWRKAYPIMDFFEAELNGVFNCRYQIVDRVILTELLYFCDSFINEGFSALDYYGWHWTDEYEKQEWYDYHMEWVIKTKLFLEKLLPSGDLDKYCYKFYAWW